MLRKAILAADGETVTVRNQWAAQAEEAGTTVTDSAWAFTGSGAITDEALAGTLATCLLTPTSCGTVTNTVTLDNGAVLIATRCVLMDAQTLRDYV